MPSKQGKVTSMENAVSEFNNNIKCIKIVEVPTIWKNMILLIIMEILLY